MWYQNERINMGMFAVETFECSFTWCWHNRYIYTNSIIKYVFLKQKMSSYAVKTVGNLFTWFGHKRYTMIMEN